MKTPLIAVAYLLSLLGIVFQSGCASDTPTGCTPKQAWYQAGASADQFRRDFAECQNEALLNQRSTSIQADTTGQAILLGMFASSSENSRQNQIIQNCMIAKGYQLVDKSSPLLADGQTTQTQVEAAINARLLGHWTLIPAPEKHILGQWDIYFLPQNRYTSLSTLINTNNQQLFPTPIEKGRYYFEESRLVTWSDTDEKPDPPIDFTVTDTELTFHILSNNEHRKRVFVKQPQ